jgi:hypothetical protein
MRTNSTQAYPDTRDGAMQCLADNAHESITALARLVTGCGTHTWVPDPAVAGVWGLVNVEEYRRGNTADIVVYCWDADFTVDEAFEERAR